MVVARRKHAIEQLRARIREIECSERARHGALAFGVPAIDSHLPERGLTLGAIHEVAGGDQSVIQSAAATLFVGGILARLSGPILWCLKVRDLFAPALAGVGLPPDRVIFVEAGDENTVLMVVEEGLRHGGLAGVVGEAGRFSLTASRRLQLAAESSGVVALIIRRWRRNAEADVFATPTASSSRWRVKPLPSSPLPVPGIGRARWRIDLVRCRGAEPASWQLEACDAQGRLALPADLADGSAAADKERRAAVG